MADDALRGPRLPVRLPSEAMTSPCEAMTSPCEVMTSPCAMGKLMKSPWDTAEVMTSLRQRVEVNEQEEEGNEQTHLHVVEWSLRVYNLRVYVEPATMQRVVVGGAE